MNAEQVEYFIRRIDEEADRKRKAIREKYPILKCLPEDLSLAHITFTDEASHNFLMPNILDARAQCKADLQNLDITVAALKDYCILGPGGNDAYEQIKNFVAKVF